MSLKGQVAIVSGASRGIGKGIAVELAIAGATVYATGRKPAARDTISTTSTTIDDLQAEVERAGGSGRVVPVYADNASEADLKALFERISKEQNGRLDLLVNNAVANVTYLGDKLNKPFYEFPEAPGHTYDLFNNAGLRGYYISAYYAAKLMVPRKSGLIVTIGSVGGMKRLFTALYGVQKEANDRMVAELAVELKNTGVRALALHPGPVDTEALNAIFSSEQKSAMFKDAESINYTGRCLVQILGDAQFAAAHNGQIVTTSELADHYPNLKDVNGEPHRHKMHGLLQPVVDQLNKLRTADLK